MGLWPRRWAGTFAVLLAGSHRCWAGLRRGAMCLGRIESYSCKMAGDDKHMFKQFCQEGQPHVLEALSPPQTTGISPSRYRGLGVFVCRAPHHRQRHVCGWGGSGFIEGMALR